MKSKVLLALALLVVVVGVLSAYLILTAGRELFAARAALSGSTHDLSEDALRSARDHLRRAVDHLDSMPARILGIVPLAGHNVRAVRAVAQSGIPVLSSGVALDRQLTAIEGQGLMESGRVRLDLIEGLLDPLRREAIALGTMQQRIVAHRTGWLLPPVWEQLDRQLRRVSSLRAGAERAEAAARLAPRLLGADGSREYLVLMLNNSELRGAGGILSGVGRLTSDGGRLRLGDFSYYRALADDPPYRSVRAPADYHRHFRAYDAASTRWVAASSSPDVPDVALVASRLYRLVRDVSSDGALVVDARGLAALLPPGSRLRVGPTGASLTRAELPRYLYERAYRDIDEQVARRDALIGVGKQAFATILRRGLGGRSGWTAAADAVAGGHVRFVSFRSDEAEILERLGITGELGTPPDDATLVTVQNYGGNKLDYYARRRVRHACEVDAGTVSCATGVSISNRVPTGLSPFVYQYEPYGLFKNFIEVYVPGDARVTAVESDGEPAPFATAREDGYTAVGLYEEIARGQERTVTVSYTLPAGRTFSLIAQPQPLAHDAVLEVALEVPAGWDASGEGEVEEGALRWSGPFDRTLRWQLAPSRRSGLAALWPRITRFWTEPVF